MGSTTGRAVRRPLYTQDERRRRDASRWTVVQGVLAPLQFLAFAVSVGLIAMYLTSGDGLGVAKQSIVIKTLFLYAIMVTGCLWERDVYGRFLFAPVFFWEDVVSMGVIALHTAYLGAMAFDWLEADALMFLALAGYAAYVVNATQFLIKLRSARSDKRVAPHHLPAELKVVE